MIILNLKGGLGNQMFQYAMGRSLAERTGQELKLDLTGYDRDHYRTFGLDQFRIIKNPATPEEIKRVKYSHGLISKGWRWFAFKILRQHHTGWEPRTLAKIIKKLGTGQAVYVDGFWQSYKYFTEIREKILAEFTLKQPLENLYPDLVRQIKNTTSVSLHIRRGDYASNPRVLKEFGVCSLNYYHRAIDFIAEKVSEPTFFIFSDDPDWVRKHLQTNHPMIYVSDHKTKDYEEVILMSLCRHNIVANSSFSWWGAWLNNNPDRLVAAPDPWFNYKSFNMDNNTPSTWIRLPRD